MSALRKRPIDGDYSWMALTKKVRKRGTLFVRFIESVLSKRDSANHFRWTQGKSAHVTVDNQISFGKFYMNELIVIWKMHTFDKESTVEKPRPWDWLFYWKQKPTMKKTYKKTKILTLSWSTCPNSYLLKDSYFVLFYHLSR